MAYATRDELFAVQRELALKEDRQRAHAMKVKIEGLERVHFLVLEELRAVHALLVEAGVAGGDPGTGTAGSGGSGSAIA